MALIVSDMILPEASVRRLEALPGVTMQMLPPHDRPWDLPPELGRSLEILLCKWPPRDLDVLPGLKLIQLCSVGYEHLRDIGFADRPLRVCNARGACDTPIAEWCLGMMVNLVRNVPGLLQNQHRACWDRAACFQQEIRGKTVGLWGYGGIGRETARLAKAFGMTVHAMTRSGAGPRQNIYTVPGTGDPDGLLPDRIFTLEQEHEFLAGLDFLVLALPHTRQSDGMMGQEQLRALPRTAYVLNPARGPIIQEAALLRALAEGWIAGAVLDTHFAYPLPPEHPLWHLPNVILTPHISGAERSCDLPGRMADLFTQNVERCLRGEPLLNEITVRQWREA
jgi:phosphoglycerate dehydrogenase-like enzyme